jgi:hypothetical protein
MDDLLNIALSEDEDGSDSAKPLRTDRNWQSESDFQKVKSEYRVKVENGEVSTALAARHREMQQQQ